MPFSHPFPFDPHYGYDLDGLLQVPAPEEAEDFAAFWCTLFERAGQIAVQAT